MESFADDLTPNFEAKVDSDKLDAEANAYNLDGWLPKTIRSWHNSTNSARHPTLAWLPMMLFGVDLCVEMRLKIVKHFDLMKS